MATHPRQAVKQSDKRKYWTPAEDARITSLWASENLVEIGRQLQRSPDAVRRRAQRLGLVPFSPMDGAFSQVDLAANFGVHHRTVARWAAEGLLKGTQHPITRRWSFGYEQVQTFVATCRDELPPRLRWVLRVYADAVKAAEERQRLAAATGKAPTGKRGKAGAA